jgi:hypothetical protein
MQFCSSCYDSRVFSRFFDYGQIDQLFYSYSSDLNSKERNLVNNLWFITKLRETNVVSNGVRSW